MGIKPDHWIRRMAKKHNMIEPFVESSVRNGVISYGVSSYGYDIRVSNEFKIFTNVNSAVVDPKNFVPQSFIDYTGDVCIIPPNSFVLSRTVEYFRIPRDVLTLCIGKSTYARCFSGDTRVALVDGTSPTLEEMARRHDEGELLWGYSVAEDGSVIVTLLDAPRYIGRDALLRLTLDNGQTIDCTPDHEFIRRDGRRTQAHELQPNDSLMPLYRQLESGHEMVYQPVNGDMYPTHRLADEWNVRNDIYIDKAHTHWLHVDQDRLNNMPWNIVGLPGADTYGTDFAPLERLASIRATYDRLRQDDERFRNYCLQQGARVPTPAQDVWKHDNYAAARERLVQPRVALGASPESGEAQGHQPGTSWDSNKLIRQDVLNRSKAYPQPASETRHEQQRKINHSLRLHGKIGEQDVCTTRSDTGPFRSGARVLSSDGSVFRRFPRTIYAVNGQSEVNHRVVKIEGLRGTHDVYCLTVPEAGNFALAAGVFVSNCGLIVNVTPLEPCFSSDTEILTLTGWKWLSDIRIGERVMGMDEQGFAQYQPVTAKQVYDYTGDLMHFANRSIDLLVTPEHKLFVNRRTKGQSTRQDPKKTGWHTIEAEAVFGAHNYEMMREVRWAGRDPGASVWINGDCYPTEAFLKFLGLWLGDGRAYPVKNHDETNAHVVQIVALNRNQHKRDYVRTVLDEMGVSYSETPEGFLFYKKSLSEYLQPHKPVLNRHVPREWFDLPPNRIDLILEGLGMADGNLEPQMITTVSQRLADDVQTLAFLSGQSAIVGGGKDADPTRILCGDWGQSNLPVYKVRLSSRHLTPKVRPEQHSFVPYSGKIYDVTVANHLIFVRRNGKAVWSGNCWEGFLTLEISNTTPLPAKVYANEGIAQLLFLAGDGECETSYADKKGKYQNQQEITLPRIESSVVKTKRKRR